MWFFNLFIPENCVVDEGTDYPGMDLNLATYWNKDKRDSAQECRVLCNRTPKCKFFGWNSNSRSCLLKTGMSGKNPRLGTTSGSACPCPNVVEGTDYPGMDLNLATGWNKDKRDSALECQALCSWNPDCVYFSWKSDTGACWLKNGISRKKPEVGTTSGLTCFTII